MKAIKTKYLGPTDIHGSRIKATDEDGNSITISYPHEARQGAEAHSKAAIALCQKMGWRGPLVAGGLKDCYVFTFAYSDVFDVPLTQKQLTAADKRRNNRLAKLMAGIT